MGRYWKRGEKKFYDVCVIDRYESELYARWVLNLIVYANNIQDARKIAWREFSWEEVDWIDVRAKWIREPEPIWRFAVHSNKSQIIELPYCVYCNQLKPPVEGNRCPCGEQMSREALALYERAAQAGDVKPLAELWGADNAK
jgi:hypothetical protein